MQKILMPALSPTMESGTLSKWLVKEGDKIKIGDIIAEIETDKALMELESIYEGTVDKLIAIEGATEIKVNDEIASVSSMEEMDNEDPSLPVGNQESQRKGISGSDNAIKNSQEDFSLQKQSPSSEIIDNQRVFASPLARRLAKENKLDINKIAGTGPRGRIIKSDIEKLQSTNRNVPITDESKDLLKTNYEEISISPIRKVVAKRMSDAKKDIPHFYLRRKISAEKLLKSRIELNETSSNAIKITINDIIVKACAQALRDFPTCNVIYKNQKIYRSLNSDVSIAVALEDGLITPIIKKAELKSLGDIASESKELINKAKEKSLKPEEYIGGSFSISNLGMVGIDNFDAIINPPQASILAVGKIIKEPFVCEESNKIVPHNVMALNLSVDHRAIDGYLGAQFLDRISFYLESPLRLLH
ncbi:MAG: pyruvate dehydrogenase complex dihydrolipoamide acetyltransferase [Paracoccaceae bacterium]